MNKIINDRIAKVKSETLSSVTPSVWEVNVSSDTDGKEYTVLLNWKNVAYLAVTGRCREFPEDFCGLLILAAVKGTHGFNRAMIAEAIRDSEYYFISEKESIVEVFHGGLWKRKIPVD